ncbi:SGNH/GDSL hydrolase family protein [Dietzia sp. 179-F 9C3 NHS]|uniref:SGNH/GDSL hydrolase family protein n=1 Tax=Dietzia sp. 179-F 9C3 NHS TaxID=3374295 RepID=UPI003879FA8B
MFTSPRALVASLALAASAALAASPAASAQSETGALDTGSLGSAVVVEATGSFAPLGSLGSSLPAPGPRTYDSYVALGDSYAALGDQTQLAPGVEDCDNSATNYPNQLDANPRVGELTDASCGGAQIPQVLESQVKALDAGTDLVTLSIGGNDVGFSTMVGCITRQGPFADLPATTTCDDAIGDQVDGDIAAVYGDGGAIKAVYAAIAERSPDATVVATRYLPLMPTEGSCAFIEQLHPADVAWARDVTTRINAAVDAAAERHGHVSVLPTDTVDRSACAPADQRWTDFQGGAPTNAAPMHPTTLGQTAMAEAIGAAI